MRKHWRDWLSWCVLLLVVLFVARRAFYVAHAEGIDRMPLRYRLLQTGFDSDDWRDARYSSTTRAKMVGDLLASHDLIGMREEQVIALLGRSSRDRWLPQDSLYLGPGFIDDWWLTIHYDAHGIVNRVWVRTD